VCTKEWCNSFESIVYFGKAQYWFRLMFVSLFPSFIAPATLAVIIHFIAAGNGSCCKLIGCRYIRTAVNILLCVYPYSLLMDGMIIFFTAWIHTSFYVKFTYLAALTEEFTVGFCMPSHCFAMYCIQNSDFQFSVLLRDHQAHSFLCLVLPSHMLQTFRGAQFKSLWDSCTVVGWYITFMFVGNGMCIACLWICSWINTT